MQQVPAYDQHWVGLFEKYLKIFFVVNMREFVSVLLVSVLVSSVSGQGRRPTISFITQPEIVTDIGGDVEMKCSIQYASDYPVIWMKLDSVDRNNDLTVTVGTTLILKDPRFNVDLDRSTSTYTLRISDVQETDGAKYQCQVIVALTDKVVADVPLIVRRPPIISDNSTRSVITWEGNRVVLRCYASGNPEPTIYWRRQNNVLLPTGGLVYKGNELVIEKVERWHRGTYYCVATNVVGTGQRRNIDVEVEHPPTIKIPRKRLGQALQFDMDLECQIEAYPPPAIKWYTSSKRSDPLTTNQHFRISYFVNDDQHVNTILRAVTIEKFQYQEYICEATNRLGSSQAKVQLFETVIPICPPACDEVNYSSEAQSLGPINFIISFAIVSLIASFRR